MGFEGLDNSTVLNLAAIRALIPVPDKEIVPSPELFLHRSSVHGQAHVARVLIHALRLIEATGFVEETRRLWAAVYLHDIARRNDWRCERHGRDAWRRLESLPQVQALFARVGVREEEHPAIAFAITAHCSLEPASSDPHYRLAALLKDADGLDRVRLGDLDPNFLRYPQAHSMVGFAKLMYRETDPAIVTGPEHFARLWLAVAKRLGIQQLSDN